MKTHSILRNWLTIGIVLGLLLNIVLVMRGNLSPYLASILPEEEWNHTEAGNRIEEASDFDVLHVGPVGGFPEREGVEPVVKAAVAYFFGTEKEAMSEELRFQEDLGATPETMGELFSLVEEAMRYLTRFSGRITRTPGVLKTVGDLIDHVTDSFSESVGYLGATPRFHVGVVFHAMNPALRTGYAIVITGYEDGEPIYEILESGAYTWSGDELEDSRVKWTFWTLEKFDWFEANAMWAPGKMKPASLAVRYLLSHLTTKLHMGPLVNAVAKEAFLCEQMTGRQWNLIEISYLTLEPLKIAPGVGPDGRPRLVAYHQATMMGIRLLFRARTIKTIVSRNGREYEVKRKEYHLDKVYVDEEREMTVEEIQGILNSTNASYFQGGVTAAGPMNYSYGYNHPWRADRMPAESYEEVGDALWDLNSKGK